MKDGLIAEQRDLIQHILGNSANDNGMF